MPEASADGRNAPKRHTSSWLLLLPQKCGFCLFIPSTTNAHKLTSVTNTLLLELPRDVSFLYNQVLVYFYPSIVISALVLVSRVFFGGGYCLGFCFTVSQVVSFEEGKKLASSHGVRFLETSARADMNVTEAFEGLATDVIERYVFLFQWCFE